VPLQWREGTNPIEIEAPRDYPTARKLPKRWPGSSTGLRGFHQRETMVRQPQRSSTNPFASGVRRAREKVAVLILLLG